MLLSPYYTQQSEAQNCLVPQLWPEWEIGGSFHFITPATPKCDLILKTISEIILTFSNTEPKAFIYNLAEPLKRLFIITVAISEAYWNASYTATLTTQDETARMRGTLQECLLSQLAAVCGQTDMGTKAAWRLASCVTLGHSLETPGALVSLAKEWAILTSWDEMR